MKLRTLSSFIFSDPITFLKHDVRIRCFINELKFIPPVNNAITINCQVVRALMCLAHSNRRQQKLCALCLSTVVFCDQYAWCQNSLVRTFYQKKWKSTVHIIHVHLFSPKVMKPFISIWATITSWVITAKANTDSRENVSSTWPALHSVV
jgi:hypothetical protein